MYASNCSSWSSKSIVVIVFSQLCARLSATKNIKTDAKYSTWGVSLFSFYVILLYVIIFSFHFRKLTEKLRIVSISLQKKPPPFVGICVQSFHEIKNLAF